MENYLIDDSTYKYIYKLPSNAVLEFDFSFKKGENYENIMYENFEQEKIPKILLSDVNILMTQFLYEERKSKNFYGKTQKENLNSKFFLQNVINQWLSIKTFKNHIELNSNNNKHISHNWQKYAIIKFYNQLEKVFEFEKNYTNDYNKLLDKKEMEENNLRNKQEREMQEANLKNLQLDLIVNRHIGELNKFIREYEETIIDFRSNWRDKFLKIIELSFQNFIENVDPTSIIYNSDNKLIQIKINNKNSFVNSGINNELSDTKSVKSTKSIEKKNSNINSIENNNLIFTHKINFGLFNKNKLNFFFFKVNENAENDMKRVFLKFNHNLHLSNVPKNIDTDDYSINDILKSCDNFGENVFAAINFFTYDKQENKIIHTLDNLNSVTSKIQNELFFDTFSNFFLKIENQCKKGNFPFEFDIFTTKHTVSQSFDVLMNIFLKEDNKGEEDLNTVIKNVLYFANIFKINILIFPLEIIMEKFFKIHKFSDMKNFIKYTKLFINQIKNNFLLIIKSGIKIYLKNIIFTISQNFIIGFDKSKTLQEFREKFNTVFNKY